MRKSWKNIEIKLAFYFKETWLYRITGCHAYTVVITHEPSIDIELFLLYWSIL
jgi:hypothetical protein